MSALRVIIYLFEEKIMLKSHLIKSNHRVLRKNEVYTYGPPVFACYYTITLLKATMCSNSKEQFYVY